MAITPIPPHLYKSLQHGEINPIYSQNPFLGVSAFIDLAINEIPENGQNGGNGPVVLKKWGVRQKQMGIMAISKGVFACFGGGCDGMLKKWLIVVLRYARNYSS